MATKKNTGAVADQAAPVYSKEQLVNSKTLGLPRDAVAAILKAECMWDRLAASSVATSPFFAL